MGVIKRGILGGFSNKVANVVGSSWKGIAVIKSLPLSVANPDTALQQTYRGRMTAIVEVSKVLLSGIIKPLWDRFAIRMSGYNAFVKENISNFTSAGMTTPANLVISKGVLYPAPIVGGTLQNDGTGSLVWDADTTGQDGGPTDLVYVVLYNNNLKEFYVPTLDDNLRSDAGSNFTFPLTWLTGHVVYCYLATRRADGFKVSDTVYSTETIEAA